jgi:hypothetical protein
MKDMLGGAAVFVFGAALFLLYIFGMYKIVVDDHRYTTKDVAIGMFVFPYPWWVGGKEIYRISTTSSEDRALEEKCLDATEALGLRQKSRLRFCECIVETRDEERCKQKIFTK